MKSQQIKYFSTLWILGLIFMGIQCDCKAKRATNYIRKEKELLADATTPNLASEVNYPTVEVTQQQVTEEEKVFQERSAVNDITQAMLKKTNEAGTKAQALEQVLQKLRKNEKIDWKQSLALNEAIALGDKAIIKILLKQGATLDLDDTFPVQPLNLAIEQRDEELLNMLIASGVGLNKAINKQHPISKQTPIYIAIHQGMASMVNQLLDHGARLDIQDSAHRLTPYHEAIISKQIDILKVLLDRTTDMRVINEAKTSNGDTALILAIKLKQNTAVKAIIQMLLSKEGIDIHVKDDTEKAAPLFFAVKTNNQFIMEKLLAVQNAQVDIREDEKQTTALHLAASKGYQALVQSLLAHQADVNATDIQGKTPLHYAVEQGKDGIVEILLQNNHIHINQLDNTPRKAAALHYAAYKGYDSIVNSLLAKGAEVDICTASQSTALHYAAYKGYDSIVDSLLAKGAQVDKLNASQATVLHLAANKNIAEKLLGKAPQLLNAIDYQGNTLLHTAARKGQKELVEYLLNQPKIKKNIKNNEKKTACELATDPAIRKLFTKKKS